MEILKIIIWAIAIFMLIGWIIGTRKYIKQGLPVMNQTAVIGMLILISILTVLILGLSSYNFIWMIPTSIIIGTFSLAFPFSLLYGLGRIFGKLCCVGLNMNQAKINYDKYAKLSEIIRELEVDQEKEKEIIRRIGELITKGIDSDEIKRIIKNEKR